ncbi:MAG: helix-turn-helix domain-containing protein [Actinomycetia bacterium]|nr:helix-turn-helix domain-containing protein [Actinomycetes bacterium]
MQDTMTNDRQAAGDVGGGEAGRLVEGWRREQADRRGTVEVGAPVADRLERLAAKAGGRPLRRLVTGWQYTRAGRIRHVVIAEQLEGWELPDGSAVMLEPEPHAEAAPKGPEITGPALRAWREREGLDVAEAAGRVEVTASTWRRWEQGSLAPGGPARVLLADLLATLGRRR